MKLTSIKERNELPFQSEKYSLPYMKPDEIIQIQTNKMEQDALRKRRLEEQDKYSQDLKRLTPLAAKPPKTPV